MKRGILSVLIVLLLTLNCTAQGINWVSILQSIDAQQYQNKRFRFSGAAKINLIDPKAYGAFWVRIDRIDNAAGFFDNMADRPILVNKWQNYVINGVVDSDAEKMLFGMICHGNAEYYFDEFKLQIEIQSGIWEEVLIKNPGFEQGFDSEEIKGWGGSIHRFENFRHAQSNDAYQGRYSLKVTHHKVVSEQYLVEEFSLTDYPVGAVILTSLQDRYGFLWFGSDQGLFKYDGNQFEKIDIGLGEQLQNWYEHRVTCLTEDENGDIWGWGKGGLFRFNPKNQQVFRPKIPAYSPFNSIVVDKKGAIWADTGWEFLKLDFPYEDYPDSVRVEDFEPKYPKNLYQLLDSIQRDTITSHLKIGNEEHRKHSFMIIETTQVMIVNMGESGHGQIVDYGWITNEKQETIWKNSLLKSVHAGGAVGNRIEIDWMQLHPGKYTLHYKSDIGHHYYKWEFPPPSHPNHWGIQVFKNVSSVEKIIRQWNQNIKKKIKPRRGESPIELMLDKNGNVWIGALNGLFMVVEDTISTNIMNINFELIDKYQGDTTLDFQVNKIIHGKNDTFLILSQSIDRDNNKLFKLDSFDPQNRQFTNFSTQENMSPVSTMVYDPISDDIWITYRWRTNLSAPG